MINILDYSKMGCVEYLNLLIDDYEKEYAEKRKSGIHIKLLLHYFYNIYECQKAIKIYRQKKLENKTVRQVCASNESGGIMPFIATKVCITEL